MKYHALLVIFEKAAKFEIVIGGALWVKGCLLCHMLLYFLGSVKFELRKNLQILTSNKV